MEMVLFMIYFVLVVWCLVMALESRWYNVLDSLVPTVAPSWNFSTAFSPFCDRIHQYWSWWGGFLRGRHYSSSSMFCWLDFPGSIGSYVGSNCCRFYFLRFSGFLWAIDGLKNVVAIDPLIIVTVPVVWNWYHFGNGFGFELWSILDFFVTSAFHLLLEHGSNVDSASLKSLFTARVCQHVCHTNVYANWPPGFSICYGGGIRLRGLTRLQPGVGTGRKAV